MVRASRDRCNNKGLLHYAEGSGGREGGGGMAHFYGHSRPADGRREGSLVEERERGEMPSDIRKARKVFFLLEPENRRLFW